MYFLRNKIFRIACLNLEKYENSFCTLRTQIFYQEHALSTTTAVYSSGAVIVNLACGIGIQGNFCEKLQDSRIANARHVELNKDYFQNNEILEKFLQRMKKAFNWLSHMDMWGMLRFFLRESDVFFDFFKNALT